MSFNEVGYLSCLRQECGFFLKHTGNQTQPVILHYLYSSKSLENVEDQSFSFLCLCSFLEYLYTILDELFLCERSKLMRCSYNRNSVFSNFSHYWRVPWDGGHLGELGSLQLYYSIGQNFARVYLEWSGNSDSYCPQQPSSCSTVATTNGLVVVVVYYVVVTAGWQFSWSCATQNTLRNKIISEVLQAIHVVYLIMNGVSYSSISTWRNMYNNMMVK